LISLFTTVDFALNQVDNNFIVNWQLQLQFEFSFWNTYLACVRRSTQRCVFLQQSCFSLRVKANLQSRCTSRRSILRLPLRFRFCCIQEHQGRTLFLLKQMKFSLAYVSCSAMPAW
jgi:hypothetical protein